MSKYDFDIDQETNYHEIKSAITERVTIRKYNDGFVEIYLDGAQIGTPEITEKIAQALVDAATSYPQPAAWRGK